MKTSATTADVVRLAANGKGAQPVYEILFCYRRRGGGSSFQAYWRGRRKAMVRELLADLGGPTYSQIRRASRINPLYLSIRLSRSWPFAALFSVLRGLSIPPIHPLHGGEEERWDVVESLAYSSPEAAAAAMSSQPGRAALARLSRDAEKHVRNSAAITARRYVVRTDGTLGFPRTVTMFCLRPRPPLSGAEMLQYWGTSHRALIEPLAQATGYRAYDQLHVPTDDTGLAQLCGREAAPFSGVARLCYGSQWELIRRLIDPRLYIANTRLVMDEVGFIALGESALVFGQEERL